MPINRLSLADRHPPGDSVVGGRVRNRLARPGGPWADARGGSVSGWTSTARRRPESPRSAGPRARRASSSASSSGTRVGPRPQLALVFRHAAFARNGTYLRGLGARLHAGDELAVHPPYSGGCPWRSTYPTASRPRSRLSRTCRRPLGRRRRLRRPGPARPREGGVVRALQYEADAHGPSPAPRAGHRGRTLHGRGGSSCGIASGKCRGGDLGHRRRRVRPPGRGVRAARFLIDRLKETVPIWKETEHDPRVDRDDAGAHRADDQRVEVHLLDLGQSMASCETRSIAS